MLFVMFHKPDSSPLINYTWPHDTRLPACLWPQVLPTERVSDISKENRVKPFDYACKVLSNKPLPYLNLNEECRHQCKSKGV